MARTPRSPPAGSPPPSAGGRKRGKKAAGDDDDPRPRKRAKAMSPGPGSPAATPGLSSAPTPAAPGLDDENDDEEEEEVFGIIEQEERAEARRKEAAVGQLLSYFTAEQEARFAVHSRCGVDKKNLKSLVNYVLGQSVAPVIVQSVRGAAKVFVGEMVEAARAVQAERRGEGPLQPSDYREAYRRWQAHRDSQGSERKKLFVR